MNERERRKEELLNELAKRFRDSASTMKSLASRIQAAGKQSNEHTRRINAGNKKLRDSIESDSGPLPFSYLEFLEFSNAEEFDKFNDMPLITEDEINNTDLDDLCNKLQS